MGMTVTEKILAAHCGKEHVNPGDLIEASVDLALGNDITAPLAIETFRKNDFGTVFDPEKVCLVADHFVPNKDVKSAEQVKKLREFAREQSLPHFYDAGDMGIEHALLPEQGLVLPGELVVGADSHTCTYGALGAFSTGVGSTDLAAVMATGRVWLKVPASLKLVYRGTLKPWVSGKDLILYTIGQIGVSGALYMAIEFCGDTIASLPMSGRLTMCNMAIEAGGKSGIVAPDGVTAEYVDERSQRAYTVHRSDADAEYAETREFDVSALEPQVALPHLPENVKPISALDTVTVDQVVIGSCTNGQLDDMRAAASVMKGRRVHRGLRAIIIPATQAVALRCIEEGLARTFIEAGAVFSTPTCGPCLGGHMGVLAEGERAVATTNRNFVGRMGHPGSEVYLSSPAVAAASAIAGRIAHPDEVIN
jgi:3-isopropylmalate/(R)-2-methylmalate dehydratase large subunit